MRSNLATVFVDESGKYERPDERFVGFSAVIVPADMSSHLDKRFAELRQMAKRDGARVDAPEFEFHTRSILSDRSGSFFSQMDEGRRHHLLRALANVTLQLPLPTISTGFMKPETDTGFHEIYGDLEAEPPANVTIEQPSPAEVAAGLLFGLVVGFCTELDLEPKVIVDNSFVRDTSFWEQVIAAGPQWWTTISPVPAFSRWPKRSPPNWTVHGIKEDASWKHSGLQLADLIANTIRRHLRAEREGDGKSVVPMQELKNASLHRIGPEDLKVPGTSVFIQDHNYFKKNKPPRLQHRRRRNFPLFPGR